MCARRESCQGAPGFTAGAPGPLLDQAGNVFDVFVASRFHKTCWCSMKTEAELDPKQTTIEVFVVMKSFQVKLWCFPSCFSENPAASQMNLWGLLEAPACISAASCRCLTGASRMHLWRVFSASRMHSLYIPGASEKLIKCITDASLLHLWSISETFLVHPWPPKQRPKLQNQNEN